MGLSYGFPFQFFHIGFYNGPDLARGQPIKNSCRRLTLSVDVFDLRTFWLVSVISEHSRDYELAYWAASFLFADHTYSYRNVTAVGLSWNTFVRRRRWVRPKTCAPLLTFWKSLFQRKEDFQKYVQYRRMRNRISIFWVVTNFNIYIHSLEERISNGDL